MLDAMRAASKNLVRPHHRGHCDGLAHHCFRFLGHCRYFSRLRRQRSRPCRFADDQRRCLSFCLSERVAAIAAARARRAITNDEARKMGLDREVLARLLSNAILDQTAHHFGLALSDHDLALEIVQDPAFKGPGGKFDQQDFDNRLQEIGLTEQRLSRNSAYPICAGKSSPRCPYGLAPPNAMKDAFIAIITKPAASISPVYRKQHDHSKPPTERRLQPFMRPALGDYRTREFARFLFCRTSRSSEQLAKNSPISDADVKNIMKPSRRDASLNRRSATSSKFPSRRGGGNGGRKNSLAGETFEALVTDRKLIPRMSISARSRKIQHGRSGHCRVAFSLPGAGFEADQGAIPLGSFARRQMFQASVIPFEQVELPLRQEMGLIRAHTKFRRCMTDRRFARLGNH